MKLKLIWVRSNREAWLEALVTLYKKKISDHINFEIIEVKSPSLARDSKETKKLKEGELIVAKISAKDYLVVLDEKGKLPRDSIDFSQQLTRFIESGKASVVFVVGGAFGLSPIVLDRAQDTISLSKLTLSHQVALAVSLEQLYRALCIRKGLPYHNH